MNSNNDLIPSSRHHYARLNQRIYTDLQDEIKGTSRFDGPHVPRLFQLFTKRERFYAKRFLGISKTLKN